MVVDGNQWLLTLKLFNHTSWTTRPRVDESLDIHRCMWCWLFAYSVHWVKGWAVWGYWLNGSHSHPLFKSLSVLMLYLIIICHENYHGFILIPSWFHHDSITNHHQTIANHHQQMISLRLHQCCEPQPGQADGARDAWSGGSTDGGSKWIQPTIRTIMN